MADNLLDTIRANTAALPGQQPGVTDETQKLSTLLRAKSGKSVSGPEVGASNLGEQQAVAQSQNQLKNQVMPEAAIQNSGMQQQQTTQQQQVGMQKAEVAQSRKFDTIQTRMKIQNTLQDLEQNVGKMDMARKTSAVNQVAQNLRLSNQQYTDNLSREGARSRLDDANGFNEALTKSMFGANQNLLETELGNKSILDVSNREFQQAMGKLDTAHAYQIFHNEMKTEKEQGLVKGLTGAAAGGIGAAAQAGMFSSSSAPEGQSQYATPAGPGGGEATNSLALPSIGIKPVGPD